MTVIDYIKADIVKYPTLYCSDNFETSKFAVLHQAFIVLGNGIEWAETKNPNDGGYLTEPKHIKRRGEWVRKLDSKYGVEKCNVDISRYLNENVYMLRKISSVNKYDDRFFINSDFNNSRIILESDIPSIPEKYYTSIFIKESEFNSEIEWLIDKVDKIKHYRKPYPNFSKQYSPFWEDQCKYIKPDWNLAAIEHLYHWLNYFKDDSLCTDFRNDYLSEKAIESFKSHIIKYYIDKNVSVDEICKNYNCYLFDGGNYEEFQQHRYNKELKDNIEFLEETIYKLLKI